MFRYLIYILNILVVDLHSPFQADTLKESRMERILRHPVLEETKEQYEIIRGDAGLSDDQKLQECLEAIEDWLKKQEHLLEAFNNVDRDFLERILVINKGSVEATKARLEKMFTIRGLMPELCANRSVEEYEMISESVIFVPLPKLSLDLSRVMLIQSTCEGWEDFTFLSILRCITVIGEYRLYCDYCMGERYIADLQGININFLTKINPLMVKKAEILGVEGYGLKIKGIHFLNAPPFIDKILMIFKRVLKKKVACRIHVHNTYEELYEHIPKEILPVEYGGDALSCKELNAKWIKCLKTEEARRLMANGNKLVADESKRSEFEFNEEYLGMPGSFRRLTAD